MDWNNPQMNNVIYVDMLFFRRKCRRLVSIKRGFCLKWHPEKYEQKNEVKMKAVGVDNKNIRLYIYVLLLLLLFTMGINLIKLAMWLKWVD